MEVAEAAIDFTRSDRILWRGATTQGKAQKHKAQENKGAPVVRHNQAAKTGAKATGK